MLYEEDRGRICQRGHLANNIFSVVDILFYLFIYLFFTLILYIINKYYSKSIKHHNTYIIKCSKMSKDFFFL